MPSDIAPLNFLNRLQSLRQRGQTRNRYILQLAPLQVFDERELRCRPQHSKPRRKFLGHSENGVNPLLIQRTARSVASTPRLNKLPSPQTTLLHLLRCRKKITGSKNPRPSDGVEKTMGKHKHNERRTSHWTNLTIEKLKITEHG